MTPENFVETLSPLVLCPAPTGLEVFENSHQTSYSTPKARTCEEVKTNALLKMICLFPRCDVLVPWRVSCPHYLLCIMACPDISSPSNQTCANQSIDRIPIFQSIQEYKPNNKGNLPSRELTYRTWGKGNSSSKVPW